MAKKNYYDEDFKRTLVELYHNGKTQASLIKEYGVSPVSYTHLDVYKRQNPPILR